MQAILAQYLARQGERERWQSDKFFGATSESTPKEEICTSKRARANSKTTNVASEKTYDEDIAVFARYYPAINQDHERRADNVPSPPF